MPRKKHHPRSRESGSSRNEYLQELDRLWPTHKVDSPVYVSLYCGGGGLDLGFAAAGFKPGFSTDLSSIFCSTVERNLPGHAVEAFDMNNLKGSHVLKALARTINRETPDVVIGGPPCQSFSILGDRKSTTDPRGKLVFEYARFIRETKPAAFLFENVPGILTVNEGADWDNLLAYFHEQTGFTTKWTRMNAVTFGVPQARQRVFIVGFRETKTAAKFQWPEPTYAVSGMQLSHDLKPPRAARLALEGVDGVANHVLREHGERVVTRYSKIPPGERDKKDHTDRIHPDRPSGTVLVGSGAGGGRPFIHPMEHRHITVREAARLQSFPDWWVFEGGPTAAYRQVGNAVPPLLGKAVATSLLAALR